MDAAANLDPSGRCAMLGLIREIIDLIGPVFASVGYLIVAGAVLAERSVLIGLIVPGDIVIALGGIYAADGTLRLELVIVIAVFAALVGESTGWWIGRRYGMRIVRRVPFGARIEGKVDGLRRYFADHGGKTVAVGRFAVAAGALIPFVAGLSRMPYRRFIAFDIPAVIVWATGITLVGYTFGRNLDLVETILSRFGWAVLGLVAVIVGVVVWRRRRRSD